MPSLKPEFDSYFPKAQAHSIYIALYILGPLSDAIIQRDL